MTLAISPTVSNLKVYQDLNNNGEVDSEDRQIMLDNLSAQIKLGQSESIQLIVQALSDANGEDGDTADIKIGAIILEDPSIAAVEAIDRLLIIEPEIKFTTPQFDGTKADSQIGDNVYIDASYAQCNVQSDKPDQVWITVKSPATGDTYSLKGIETGNNTGKYRLTAPTQNNANAIDDKMIQTLVDDTLTSTIDFSDDAYFTIISANDLQIQLINEGYSSLTLNVYPSFSSGEFQVVISDENSLEGELTIFNVVGQLIIKQKVTGTNTIYQSFNNLASGEYIVRYKDANNSINQRLIIAK